MMFLNLDSVAAAKINTSPYEYMIIDNFIKDQYINELCHTFPNIIDRGSFPKKSLNISPLFASFLEEIEGLELKNLLAKKFNINLSNRPVMSTIRGYTGLQDGKIHIDSKGKLITILIYMNKNWSEDETGNLRILNSNSDIEDYAVEVPAKAGTMVVFKCTENAWHGHKEFSGQRRAIQTNYVTSYPYLIKEQIRHRLSSALKHIKKSMV